ncbi:FIST C-terminal domain-containing protein [Candidatus Kaiserbacteria bacterium]|nr:FIST C-terminal domain-containing protein [Candidatus Kaiserbacteria bacterium]
MFIATSAVNYGTDDMVVGVEVAGQALSALQAKVAGALPQIVYVFASIDYKHEQVLSGIRSVVGENSIIVGTTTSGEISNDGPSKRQSVVVLFLYSDTIQFTATYADDLQADSYKAGQDASLAIMGSSPQDSKLLMIFPDGLNGNGSSIIAGLTNNLGENFPVIGGSASDNGAFTESKQFFQEQVLTNSVVAVGLSGALHFSVGIKHGWSPVGAPRQVTKSEGSKIIEINNKPAISFYEQYLGVDEVSSLKDKKLGSIAQSYPLGLKSRQGGDTLLRAPFTAGLDGSIIFGGEIKEGENVRMMVGSKEDAVEAAKEAAKSALEALKQTPQVAFVFSNHARKSLFASSEESSAEIKAIQDVIGKDVPLAGFYTYAEQAPANGTSDTSELAKSEFQNETIVVVLLAESEL